MIVGHRSPGARAVEAPHVVSCCVEGRRVMGSAPGLSELRRAVCAAAAAFDAALLDRDAAMGAVHESAAIVNAAQAMCDMAACRVAECDSMRGAADEVARATGTSNAKARERIETGKRL